MLDRYDASEAINSAAFIDGWFKTGDEGFLDADGYLHLTGRIKEIINRGGEKISPREVDDILIEHPAIEQVCTFAYPHDTLGEEVGVAIVLSEGAIETESSIRAFASARLADFKVPKKIIFLKELPKGPTGKLQRIGFFKLVDI
ncbi:hypothetical protein RvVAR0630_18500 [Agrobacterium vitis]|nr:hypothetical protein RvVAR0630_18500 [Agrobacterium vitis]